MTIINNLAQFKRAIKVGVQVGTIHHMVIGRDPETKEYITQTVDRGVRAVSKAQSASFALKTIKGEPVAIDPVPDDTCTCVTSTEIHLSDYYAKQAIPASSQKEGERIKVTNGTSTYYYEWRMKEVDSWCYYDTADMYSFDGTNKVCVYDFNKEANKKYLILEYTILDAPATASN